MPDWTLALRYSDFGLLLLPSGPTTTTGVIVSPDGFIISRGKSRAWVIRQMESFLIGFGIVTLLPAPKRAKA